MCSFAPDGPGPGRRPTTTRPAALQADADALRIPIRLPAAARRLALQLRQPRRDRRRPHGPVRAAGAGSVVDRRLPRADRDVSGLTQSNADEEKLVGSIDTDMVPTGTQDVDGVRWVVYEGGEECRAGVDDAAERPDRTGADRDNGRRRYR